MAEGPEGGQAYWLDASDGVRIRIGCWTSGSSGTVLLFSGRTEYIEKYGRVAGDLANAGYSTVVVDWRGQGLADRVARDKHIGHVADFADYQLDVAAVMTAVEKLNMPRPFHLLGHSMGGAIGLRALTEGLDVKSAVFSAPMWGIKLPTAIQPFSGLITSAAKLLGLSLAYAPGTGPRPYVLKCKFDANALTHDRDTYGWLQTQVRAEPGFGLGGPSMHWLHTAFAEMEQLRQISTVPCPALAFVGSDEAIVEADYVHELANSWDTGRSETITNAQHEVMMESEPNRSIFMEKTISHFNANHL
ncbi:MAG: alpha/beta hydrolase [Pseudomonadota bacterium]